MLKRERSFEEVQLQRHQRSRVHPHRWARYHIGRGEQCTRQRDRFPYVGRPWEPFPAVSYSSLVPSFDQINEDITGLVVFSLTADDLTDAICRSTGIRENACRLRTCMLKLVTGIAKWLGTASPRPKSTRLLPARTSDHEDGSFEHVALLGHVVLCDTGLNSS